MPSQEECAGKRLGASTGSPAGHAGGATTGCWSTSSCPLCQAGLALPRCHLCCLLPEQARSHDLAAVTEAQQEELGSEGRGDLGY